MAEFEETRFFKMKTDKENETRDIILKVYRALKEKGHNPVSQIAG
ncbi:MAG TPA: IreB family regulatory phosphoprotein, partial [Firmicutes bacterium]|nr:IreB family regulatory phosphoprotein [Candidatus Fermentithermobacillaceae bacterium]